MYSIYVIDYDGSYIELDAEDFEFGVEFKSTDITDLSLRSGNRTQELTLKGTDRNNNAFGYIYRLGRTSDITLENKLFFNYNSLRQVDCIVYHNTNLLFRGSLRIIGITRVKGVIYYKVVLTDAVIDLIKYSQDRLLTDIDLSHLKHEYKVQTITQSWSYQTQRWNGTTYSYTPFELGSGYVYGYVNYGLTPSSTSIDNVYNYRQSIYVKEVMNGIIGQTALGGYTWELSADSETTNKFNSLVIPNNTETLSTLISGLQETVYRCSGTGIDTSVAIFGGPYYNYLNTPCRSASASSSFQLLTLNNGGGGPAYGENAIWNVNSTITCDAYIKVDYEYFGFLNQRFDLNFYLSERPYTSGGAVAGTNWTVVAYKTKSYGASYANGVTHSDSVEMYVRKRVFDSSKQISLRVVFSGPGSRYVRMNPTASLTLPYTVNDVKLDIPYGSPISANLPENVKQYDFIKSLMLMFNLYAYVEKERPKHIIFKTYDDYYALCDANNIKDTAIDWTKKIVYNEDWTKTLNISIPKRYTFTYKEDKDYINSDYKDLFNSVYGNLSFTDKYGVSDEKKVELIFSPSPLVNANGKNFPYIRGGDSVDVKTINSNIRIVYFNGVKDCPEYDLVYTNQAGISSTASVSLTQYGELSEYYSPNSNNVFIDSLQFGLPRKIYFPFANSYTNLPNLYSNYYRNQISELTDSNLFVMDCKVYLTELDIARFDLRTPIFIQTDIGNSYFKVVELSWKDSKSPATVKLQSILFGG